MNTGRMECIHMAMDRCNERAPVDEKKTLGFIVHGIFLSFL